MATALKAPATVQRPTASLGKLFLSHLHHVMYEDRYGAPPPKPYILSHGDHAHFVSPPHWPMD